MENNVEISGRHRQKLCAVLTTYLEDGELVGFGNRNLFLRFPTNFRSICESRRR
jgi:hypothetical protein